MYKFFFKRFFDLLISTIGFMVLLPVFIVLTLLLFITNTGSPFFLQTRPGKNERIFKVIKFKTMNDRTDSKGELLPDFKRITMIGKFIRESSLDEIPQLINVIKGDMSLIGPRPLLVEYLQHYNNTQRRRHEVRPGITGLAQVNGRNTISWEEKFQYDVWYIDHLTFSTDVKILWLTFFKTIKREGTNQQKELPMGKFTGSN